MADPVIDNGRLAGNYLKTASYVIGSAPAQRLITYENADYIIPLRDAVIAAGMGPTKPLVTSLDTAHYRSSDSIELAGNLHHVALLQESGDDILRAVRWLEGADRAMGTTIAVNREPNPLVMIQGPIVLETGDYVKVTNATWPSINNQWWPVQVASLALGQFRLMGANTSPEAGAGAGFAITARP